MWLRMARRAENEGRQNSRPRETATIQVLTKVVIAEVPLLLRETAMELFLRTSSRRLHCFAKSSHAGGDSGLQARANCVRIHGCLLAREAYPLGDSRPSAYIFKSPDKIRNRAWRGNL